MSILTEFDANQLDLRLAKANEIIRDISRRYQNITPITPSDYGLFMDCFARDVDHTYGNSFLYITQGTYGIGPEKMGYKYFDGENLCALAIYPKIEDENTLMVYFIRPVGNKVLSIIAELAERIKKEYGLHCYVKKLFKSQRDYLIEQGFKCTKSYPWHSTTYSEDDAFPELIFDREKALAFYSNSTGRTTMARVRKGVERLKRHHVVEIVNDDFQNTAWKLVNRYFLEYHTFSKKPNVSSPFDYYNMIFGDYPLDKNISKKIIFVDQTPVGFYVTYHNEAQDMVMAHAGITFRHKYKYLSDYWIFTLLSQSKSKYLNLGGSEDFGIHTFKKKYCPDIEKKMYWVTNYSESVVG